MLETKAQYDNIAETREDLWEPIILDYFEIPYVVEDAKAGTRKTKKSLGFIFSCKGMLDNIPKIMRAQDMKLSLMIDGVPKILVNGSTIWNAGTTTLSRDSQDHVPRCGTYVGEEAFHHSFRPLVFGCSRTENGIAAQRLLDVIVKAVEIFYGFGPMGSRWAVVSCGMDHADALRNAAIARLQTPPINDCTTHFQRACLGSANAGGIIDPKVNREELK